MRPGSGRGGGGGGGVVMGSIDGPREALGCVGLFSSELADKKKLVSGYQPMDRPTDLPHLKIENKEFCLK